MVWSVMGLLLLIVGRFRLGIIGMRRMSPFVLRSIFRCLGREGMSSRSGISFWSLGGRVLVLGRKGLRYLDLFDDDYK